MTFIVDSAPHADESLHFSPVEEAYMTEPEALERASHVQRILGVVGTEAKAIMFAHTHPVTRGELISERLIDPDIPGPIDPRIGVRDIKRRLAPAFAESGIEPLSADNVGDAVSRYFLTSGYLEPAGKRGQENVFMPKPVRWEEAAASGGHLLDFAVRHNVSLGTLLGYARSPKNGDFATSAPLTRIGMLAYIYQVTTHEKRSVSPSEIPEAINASTLSGAWSTHLNKLIAAGFVSPRNGEDSPYTTQPEFELNYDPAGIPPEDAPLFSRIHATINTLYAAGDTRFKPAQIAEEMLKGDADNGKVYNLAYRVRLQLDAWLRANFITQVTDPERIIDRVGLDPKQREIARDLITIVDGMACPTSEFVDSGLEKLYLITSDGKMTAHLVQRTRASVPANHRKSRAELRIELRRALQEGPKTTGELAEQFGYDRRYINAVLLKMTDSGVGGEMQGRSKTWRLHSDNGHTT